MQHLMRVIWIGVLKLRKVRVSSTHVNWHPILQGQDIEIMTALGTILQIINGKHVSVTQMAAINRSVNLSNRKHSAVYLKLPISK